MKTAILLLSMFVFSSAYASGWYCEEVSSAWMEKGVLLQSCGIGYGADENEARLDAFNNARKEFENICNKDTNCASNVVNIDPQRTSCNRKEGKVVCHRLIYYHITAKRRIERTKAWEPDVIEIKRIEKPTVVNNHNTNHITVHKHYNTIKKATFKGKEYSPYKTYLRTVKGVSIYETNSRSYQGMHLYNPSEAEIQRSIKIGSRSGGMPRLYIHRD